MPLSCSFFPGFDGTIPESPASAATPADGAGEVVSGSCGCVDGYIPERNEDSELVMCRCARQSKFKSGNDNRKMIKTTFITKFHIFLSS